MQKLNSYLYFFTLLALLIYIAGVSFFSLNSFFKLDIIPSNLEKKLQEKINTLNTDDTESVNGTMNSLINKWSDLAIPALVKSLEYQTEPAKSRVVECLAEITGQNLGTDPFLWSKWIEENYNND